MMLVIWAREQKSGEEPSDGPSAWLLSGDGCGFLAGFLPAAVNGDVGE